MYGDTPLPKRKKMDSIFKDNPGLDVAYKTADGKYAKVQVTDFYKEVNSKKAPNYPKLKYQLSDTQSK